MDSGSPACPRAVPHDMPPPSTVRVPTLRVRLPRAGTRFASRALAAPRAPFRVQVTAPAPLWVPVGCLDACGAPTARVMPSQHAACLVLPLLPAWLGAFARFSGAVTHLPLLPAGSGFRVHGPAATVTCRSAALPATCSACLGYLGAPAQHLGCHLWVGSIPIPIPLPPPDAITTR